MTQRNDGYIALPTDASGRAAGVQERTDNLNARTISLPYGGTLTVFPDGKNYSYAYGPSGVAGLRQNYYSLLSAVFASIVMKDFKQRFMMNAWQEGSMTAMLELGALIGALLTGVFADRHSRKQSFSTACVVFCVGSVFQCAARSLNDLIIGRAIGGVGIGSLSMLSPLYMAEISPPEVRGSLMSLEQLAIVIGVVFGFWTGFFTRDLSGSASWRTPLAIQLIPGIILGLGCFVLPSSPRLLTLRGKADEALHSLMKLRLREPEDEHSDPLLKLELLEMQVEAELIRRSTSNVDGKNAVTAELHRWKSLFSHKVLHRSMIGIMMMFFQQWSGINALVYYGPLLMRRIGLEGDVLELLGSGGIGIVQFLAVIPAILYIDRVGRKPLLQWGGIAMGMAHLFIAMLVFLFQNDWPSHHVAAWLAVGCVYLFTLAYGLSYGPIAWVLPSEVLPLSIRSRGAALSTASNWINNFFIGLITPAFLSASPTGTFVTFSFACFAASLWSKIFVPETANVSLEDIDQLFESDASREDIILKEEIAREVGLDAAIQELLEIHA